MIVVCVDRDRYRDLLDKELRRVGGRAIKASFEEAALLVEKTDCDAVLFDPQDGSSASRAFSAWAERRHPGSSKHFFIPPRQYPYQALQQLTDTDWARHHKVTVFTHVSKEQFEREARRNEINLRRIEFYSKDGLEIPRPLKSVREMVLNDPGRYIGYDHERHLPGAITAEWIASQRELYAYLEPYVLQRLKKSARVESSLARLPVGFRYVYRLCYMTSEVGNGGFLQFLGNALSGDEQGESIIDTLAALRGIGSRLAALLEQAIRIDAADLPDAVVAAAGRASRRARSEEQIEEELQRVDQAFNALGDTWLKEFDAYVRKHPEQFVYAGNARTRMGRPRRMLGRRGRKRRQSR